MNKAFRVEDSIGGDLDESGSIRFTSEYINYGSEVNNKGK